MPKRKYHTDPAKLLAKGQKIVQTTDNEKYRHRVDALVNKNWTRNYEFYTDAITVVNLRSLDISSCFCCPLEGVKAARNHAKKFEIPMVATLVSQGLALKLTTVFF